MKTHVCDHGIVRGGEQWRNACCRILSVDGKCEPNGTARRILIMIQVWTTYLALGTLP